jgi:hypothetical protein
MVYSYKKYMIIALIGALIIGLSSYLFLNNFLERVSVIVLSHDVERGQIITEKDLENKEYYRNSLPESYVISGNEIIGKSINIDRKKGDFLREDMFEELDFLSIIGALDAGESILALNIEPSERIISELKAGDVITVMSAERDPGLLETVLLRPSYGSMPDNEDHKENFSTYIREGDYIKSTTFRISKNIISTGGQLVISGLEILEIRQDSSKSPNILITGQEDRYYVLIRCLLEEAPLLSRVLQKDSYKIVLEKR